MRRQSFQEAVNSIIRKSWRLSSRSWANGNSILAQGHGAVIVGASLRSVVSGANGMRHNARLLTQTIALGGHINPNPRGTEAPPRNQRPQVQGFSGRSGGDRSWDHFKQIILEENGGRVPVAPPAGQKVP